MTNITQHEKILSIAKVMYGDKATINAIDNVVLPVENEQHGVRVFNPYTSAADSQAVQEFFGISARKVNMKNGVFEWLCEISTTSVISHNKDLKTAISDCAYKATKSK